MNADERIAVLEAKLDRNEKDITNLFDFIRDIEEIIRAHMEKEENDRGQLIDRLSGIENGINKQKSFIGGVIFSVTSLWAIITSAIYFILKIKGS